MPYATSISSIVARTRATAEHFEIHQHQEDGRLRLQLTGELDMASGPVLEDHLDRLRAETQPVLLDLSRLAFMDSTGIHLLISAFNQARADRWQFEVDPDLSAQVEFLFKLTGMDRVIRGHG